MRGKILKGGILALMLGVALAFSTGCAGIKGALGWVPAEAETAAQGYYESYGYWLSLKETAVQWAESPAGQGRLSIVEEFVRIDRNVQRVLDDIAVLFCLASAPTADDPAPPPVADCSPVTGLEGESAFLTASNALRLATAELRRYLIAEGVREGVSR